MLLLLSLVDSHAHTIERLTLKSRIEGNYFVTRFDMDAGYGDPVIKEDEYATQPDRTWLVDQPPEKQLEIRELLLKFTQRYLQFSNRTPSGVSEVKSIIIFPDWNTSPPSFPKMMDGKAYINIIIKTPIPKEGTLDVKTDTQEYIPATTFAFYKTRDPQDDPDIIDLNRGDSYTFLTIERKTDGAAPVITETKQQLSRAIFYGMWNGFLHVIPYGLDHILFILAISLIMSSTGRILLQSLLFTLAHSITYILLGMGWISLPEGALFTVEIIIGLAIIALAAENLYRVHKYGNDRLGKFRIRLIFLFGLIHGLGYASAMSDKLEVQGSSLLYYLLSANIGIEIAQLVIIITACLIFSKLSTNQRVHVNRIGSILIAAAAIYLLLS